MPNDTENRIEALCELENERQAAEWRAYIIRECERWDRVMLYEQGEPNGE